MADQKVTALGENTTVATTDILYLVDDPGGTPASEKATVANVVAAGMVDIGARVYNSGAITLTTGATTALTFDSESYDTDTIHSTVANQSRLTATTAGKYLIWGNVSFAANSAGVRIVKVQLNGATDIHKVRVEPVDLATHPTEIAVCCEYSLSAADYVELYAFQNSGGNLDVEQNTDWTPVFGMRKVG